MLRVDIFRYSLSDVILNSCSKIFLYTILTSITIACLSGWVEGMFWDVDFQVGCVCLIHVSKQSIYHSLVEHRHLQHCLMLNGSGDFWNHDFPMYECTTGHPPFCLCVLLWLWSLIVPSLRLAGWTGWRFKETAWGEGGRQGGGSF